MATVGAKANANGVAATAGECDPSNPSGTPCNACWSWYEDGEESTWADAPSGYDGIAQCGVDEAGASRSTCAGMQRSDVFGDFCRSWCTKNPAICTSNNSAYCAYPDATRGTTNADQSECRCWTGATWGGGSSGANNVWNQQGNTQTWADVTTQIASYGLPGETACYAMVCQPYNVDYVLANYQLTSDEGQCPHTEFYCTVNMKDVQVNIIDVQSSSINIFQDGCTSNGSGKGGSQPGTNGKPNSWTAEKKYLPYAAGVFILLVLAAGYFAWSRFTHSQFQSQLIQLESAAAQAAAIRHSQQMMYAAR